MSFRVDKEAGIVYRTISGEVTTDELLRSYAAVLRHPDFRPGMKALTDMRGIKPKAFRSDVLRVAEFISKHEDEIGDLRIAVVVSADASYGIVRELEAELERTPVEIGLFRDMAEAEEWLGLPADA
jgi:hypothetical protein